MVSHKKTKKVIFLLPTLFQGGGERVVSELSLNLPGRIEVVIVLYEKKITYPYRGRIVSLRVPLTSNLLLGAAYFLVRFYRFKKVLAEEKPDYVVSLGASCNILSLLAGNNPIVRVDMFISEARKGLKGWFFKFLLKKLAFRATKFIPVAQSIGKDLIKAFRIPESKVQVIHNPVDIEKIKRLSREPIGEAHAEIFRHPVIITMGRLKEQKAQQYLICAFAEVRHNLPEAKLVILGEGPRREYLEGEIQRMNMKKSVHLLGWQNNPFPLLARSNVFVLSSLWEGLPDVLLEAMAVGLPVVSSDCMSGPREILAPRTSRGIKTKEVEVAENGILVPVRNAGALAEAIILLLNRKSLEEKMRERSRKRAEDFSVKRLITKWDALLK